MSSTPSTRPACMFSTALVGAACLLAAAALIFMAGCAGTATSSDGDQAVTSPQAEQLFTQLEQAYALQRDGRTLELADRFLIEHSSHPAVDRALGMAADAAERRRDVTRALGYFDRLLAGYPTSPEVDARLSWAADLALTQGEQVRAAGYLVASFAREPLAPSDTELEDTTRVLRELSADQLQALASIHAGDRAEPFLMYLVAESLAGEGGADRARPMVTELAERFPSSPWTAAAAGLVGDIRSGRSLVAGPVDPTRIGVVCPLTGRYALLGNAFYEAALTAAAVTNEQTGIEFELVVENSAGDPVAAALAGRKLSGPGGCIALLGSLMSDPTAALAVVADQFGIPLVSPTATNDRIWELGEGIHQTNLTGVFEVRMLARLATTLLLKRTYGLLYPDTPEAARQAEIFAREVTLLGGEVVVEAAFPSQGTDFREAILTVRQARPEVIFSPSSVDQMVMLGPQLDFYRAGSLVMGLSNWNNEKLAEHSQSVLERALFPDDQALLPPEWADEFYARWDQEAYPREATALALKTYQSTRLLLTTLVDGGASTRKELSGDLADRLAERSVEAAGPDSFGILVQMFSNGEIEPFPAELYVESWEPATASPDSLPSVIDEDLPRDD